MWKEINIGVDKAMDFFTRGFPSVSHLLIDRHLEHFIIFDGLETEYESSVKLLCGVAPEGGLVPIGEVDAAAAARMEHSDSSSDSRPPCVVAPASSFVTDSQYLEYLSLCFIYKCG